MNFQNNGNKEAVSNTIVTFLLRLQFFEIPKNQQLKIPITACNWIKLTFIRNSVKCGQPEEHFNKTMKKEIKNSPNPNKTNNKTDKKT